MLWSRNEIQIVEISEGAVLLLGLHSMALEKVVGDELKGSEGKDTDGGEETGQIYG